MNPLRSVDVGSTERAIIPQTGGRLDKQQQGRRRASKAVYDAFVWAARLATVPEAWSCQPLPQPHHWRTLFVSVFLVGFFWLVVWLVPVNRESRIRAHGHCEPASRSCSVDGEAPERVLALRDRSRPIVFQVARGRRYVASLDPSTHVVSFVADAPFPDNSFDGYLIVSLVGRPLFR
jgi:hypothetical protein